MKNDKKTITITTPISETEGLYIPPELMSEAGLENADDLCAFTAKNALLLLNDEMTPRQLVGAIKMLRDVGMVLINRLASEARDYQQECVPIFVPRAVMEASGIPKGAPLDILADEGEIYIAEALVECEEDEPLYGVPSFLQDILRDQGLNLDVLGLFLGGEDEDDEE